VSCGLRVTGCAPQLSQPIQRLFFASNLQPRRAPITLCAMRHALCPMPSVLMSQSFTLCAMPSAQCFPPSHLLNFPTSFSFPLPTSKFSVLSPQSSALSPQSSVLSTQSSSLPRKNQRDFTSDFKSKGVQQVKRSSRPQGSSSSGALFSIAFQPSFSCFRYAAVVI
jgi:hypothetical protein